MQCDDRAALGKGAGESSDGQMSGAGSHSAIAVANKFLEMAGKAGRRLTPMHLQKLVYIAHRWSLAIYGEPLVKDPVEAWPWGPVYPELYEATKKYGSGPVTAFIRQDRRSLVDHLIGEWGRERFQKKEEDLLNAVFQHYGDLEPFQLSVLTHKDGTPWTKAYRSGGRGSLIPNALIEQYFYDIGSQASA